MEKKGDVMMSTQERTRSLEDLATRSLPLLDLDGGRENNRNEFIKIAGKESPTKTFDLVWNKAINYGFDPDLADEVARAARFLAIIKRDYGQEVFSRITAR